MKAETLASLARSDASDEDNFKSVVDAINLLQPKGKARVIAGEETSEGAVVELQGEMTDGGPEVLYLVRMVKEGQGWRFDRAAVVGFL